MIRKNVLQFDTRELTRIAGIEVLTAMTVISEGLAVPFKLVYYQSSKYPYLTSTFL